MRRMAGIDKGKRTWTIHAENSVKRRMVGM